MILPLIFRMVCIFDQSIFPWEVIKTMSKYPLKGLYAPFAELSM